MDNRIKLLYLADLGNTGFGTVTLGFLPYLHATGKFNILMLGINYMDLAPANVPWGVISSGFWHKVGNQWQQDDPYGTLKVQKYIEWFDPDVFMLNNDFQIADKYWITDDDEATPFALHRSKKVLYAPLDSEPCPPFFAESAKKWDMVIAYTHWEKKLLVDRDEHYKDMPVIYHGVNPDVFKPMDKAEAKAKLKEIFLRANPKAELPDFTKKYLVYFNGTNQFRKDLPALFRAFAEFRSKVKNAFLLPHTSMMPNEGGWYLPNLAGLTGVRDVVLMKNANVFSQEDMNVFYNAADVLAYPTRGEGFGLPSLEAMATKTPVIATKFGPQKEIHENGRGYFIRVMGTTAAINHGWTWFALPDWKDLARQLYHVYANPDEAAATAERAYAWVGQHSWQSKAVELEGILMKLAGEQGA